jgi:hypothetical protein
MVCAGRAASTGSVARARPEAADDRRGSTRCPDTRRRRADRPAALACAFSPLAARMPA